MAAAAPLLASGDMTTSKLNALATTPAAHGPSGTLARRIYNNNPTPSEWLQYLTPQYLLSLTRPQVGGLYSKMAHLEAEVREKGSAKMGRSWNKAFNVLGQLTQQTPLDADKARTVANELNIVIDDVNDNLEYYNGLVAFFADLNEGGIESQD
ncbi:MAG: hypothetical protein M1829_000530 [Trizodia sp. TS-e1964]|nr:MAG: hypothetical protein M1829_000530 [Trizodia sp. TS-e1964]